MSLNLGRGFLSRWRQFFSAALSRRVVWFSSARRDLNGLPSTQFAWVAIIGREHYEQVRRKYPIRSWRDLRTVVRLEFGQYSRAIFSIGPLADDERAVSIYKIASNCQADSVRALFWIPESEVLSRAQQSQDIVTVEREQLRYFIAPNGQTLIAGGAIQTPEIFALAAGVPSTSSGLELSESELTKPFSDGLSALKAADWVSFLSADAVSAAARIARPALVVSAVALAAYLALVSSYLSSMEVWRTRQLDDLGPEVTTLIAKQRAIDVLMTERGALAEVANSSAPAWPIWEPVAAIWKAGGAVYSVNLSDRAITIRCSAAVATEVLKALQALKGFQNVRFDSAVRQGGVGQEFVVSLERASVDRVPL